ncbi:hypothetical protein LINPERHAP2_LOCUS38546 [Linum perenne]
MMMKMKMLNAIRKGCPSTAVCVTVRTVVVWDSSFSSFVLLCLFPYHLISFQPQFSLFKGLR